MEKILLLLFYFYELFAALVCLIMMSASCDLLLPFGTTLLCSIFKATSADSVKQYEFSLYPYT
jgi:hypothetical protein